MGRRRDLSPRYLEHKQSGRGRAVWYDAAGTYHDVLLPGPFQSRESLDAYGRLMRDMVLAPAPAVVGGRVGLTVVEVLAAYLTHAERHYRKPDGSQTSELREHKLVMKALRENYGETAAAEFGPLKLKALRQGWVGAGLSRGECNRRTGIARRIFAWAVAEELVPATVLTALDAVKGLQAGRTAARETEPIEPVADETVDKTLPHLNRFLVGLVELQRLTGMRPGEACIIRRSDIDTGGKVWLYTVEKHKTRHKGKKRVVAVGPKAQAVLKPFFTTDINAYLFPPRLAVAELHASRTKVRTTPKYDSHMKRNARKRAKLPRRAPAEHYTAESYSHAIAKACDKAFPAPAPLGQRKHETAAAWKKRLTTDQKAKLKDWQQAHRWAPNQLRHTFATRVRKEHGLEAAQVLLGHSRADVTQVYAERDNALAVAIAAKMG